MPNGSDHLFEGMSLIERKFADAYVGEANGNASEALRLSGAYPNANSQTLRQRAYEYIRRPKVVAYIEAMYEMDDLVMSRQQRLRSLSAIAWGQTTDEKLDKEGGRIELRTSTADRLNAMAQLAKASGEKMRLEVTTTADKLSDEELLAVLARAGVKLDQLSVGRDEKESGTLDQDDDDEPE